MILVPEAEPSRKLRGLPYARRFTKRSWPVPPNGSNTYKPFPQASRLRTVFEVREIAAVDSCRCAEVGPCPEASSGTII